MNQKLDVNIELITKICGNFLPQDESFLSDYYFNYERTDHCNVGLFFSLNQFKVSITVNHKGTPISSIDFKQVNAVKILDVEKKIIEITDLSNGENSTIGTISLSRDPILSVTNKNLSNLMKVDFYDFNIISIFDSMIEDFEHGSLELFYKKNDHTVILTIFIKEHSASVEIKTSNITLSKFNFIKCVSINVLDLQNKCFEIIGFVHHDHAVRCFLTLSENLISIVDMDTNYRRD